jgi:hypothetical protein
MSGAELARQFARYPEPFEVGATYRHQSGKGVRGFRRRSMIPRRTAENLESHEPRFAKED